MTRVNRAYRYPPALRVVGLFVSLLAGSMLLGSVIAEIEAADPLDFVVHLFGALVGAAIVWLGLEFGLRRIAPTTDGIVTRLLHERIIAWREVRLVREGPLGTLLIITTRRHLIVVWPYLEDFGALIEALDAARREQKRPAI